MSKWKGSLISASATAPSSTNYTGRADGKWSVQDQLQAKQASSWAKSVGNPTAPTIGTATAGNANASVAFTPSSEVGATGSLTYTATSTPGSFTATGSSSPITVSGLTNGTQYTFKVNATNSLGLVSPDSAASNSTGTTVPGAPTIGTATPTVSQTVSVTFTPPANTGGLTITGYTATSSPGSITGTAASSPVTVAGLTNGTSYTFTVVATNALGNSLPSSASNAATPVGSISSVTIATTGTPYIQSYLFDNGFGTKYANPSTLPAGNGQWVDFNAANTVVVLVGATSPYATAYTWSTAGFGTKYANPATLPSGTCYGCSVNQVTGDVAVSHATSPYASVYNWSSGFGTKYANPATLPPVSAIATAFNLTGNLLVVGGETTNPSIGAYPWSNGFGTKYANPATATSGNCDGVGISKDSNAIFVGSDNGTTQVYSFSGGFGAKFAAPASAPTGFIATARFSTSDIVIGTGSWPYIYSYPWNSSTGFGVKYANPSTDLTNSVYSLSFNTSENILAAATASAPFINAYNWIVGTGFGTKYANPSTAVSGTQCNGISFRTITI